VLAVSPATDLAAARRCRNQRREHERFGRGDCVAARRLGGAVSLRSGAVALHGGAVV
jgi:hypothetical protein